MRKNVLYLMVIITVLGNVISCGDDKENHKEKWMITNLGALNAIKVNPEYKELRSPGNEGSIYYKVLKAGEGTDTIRYTSAVKCYYKGWFIADYLQYNIKAGDTFDKQLFDDGPPATFNINSLMSGWKTALQHMVKGDKWEIWVPYQLGYGRDDYKQTGRKTIPGYSTLVFEFEVTAVKNIDD